MKSRWKLEEVQIKAILEMKEQGYTQNFIAHKFNVDHSTVYYHLRKNGISTRVVTIGIKSKVPKKIIPEYRDANGDRINQGKNYVDYLKKESDKRMYRFVSGEM